MIIWYFYFKNTDVMWCKLHTSTLLRWHAWTTNFKLQRNLESIFSSFQNLIRNHEIDFEIEFPMYFNVCYTYYQ